MHRSTSSLRYCLSCLTSEMIWSDTRRNCPQGHRWKHDLRRGIENKQGYMKISSRVINRSGIFKGVKNFKKNLTQFLQKVLNLIILVLNRFCTFLLLDFTKFWSKSATVEVHCVISVSFSKILNNLKCKIFLYYILRNLPLLESTKKYCVITANDSRWHFTSGFPTCFHVELSRYSLHSIWY